MSFKLEFRRLLTFGV